MNEKLANVHNKGMPSPHLLLMTDDEIHALWLYLQAVEPQEYGDR